MITLFTLIISPFLLDNEKVIKPKKEDERGEKRQK